MSGSSATLAATRRLGPLAVLGVLAAVIVPLGGTAHAAGATSAYLEQLVTTGPVMNQPGQTTTQKIWISPAGFRVEDANSGVITIVRPEAGKVFMINTAEKSYHEMSLEQLKSLAAMGLAMMGGGKGGEAKAELTRTEETAKVGAWTAYKAVLKISGPMASDMTLWLSKDVDLDMKTWASLAEGMGMRGLVGDAVEKMASLDGYPVKQESNMSVMGMKITSSTELKSYKPGPVDAAMFEPPVGYKKTEGALPGMPAAVGAGAGK